MLLGVLMNMELNLLPYRFHQLNASVGCAHRLSLIVMATGARCPATAVDHSV